MRGRRRVVAGIPAGWAAIPGIEIINCTSGGAPPILDTMFRYFPTNYVWNLSVDLAIEMGARIGEIEEMCAPLVEASKKSDAADEDESRGFDPRGEGQDSLFVIRRGS